MLNSLNLRNFKCFKELDLSIGPLTLFAGANGTGKSSALQSLLLLRQSYLRGFLQEGRLLLNEELVQLGSGGDVLFFNATEDQVEVKLGFTDGSESDYSFEYDRGAEILVDRRPDAKPVLPGFSREGLFNENCRYLVAERIGPRAHSPTSDVSVRHLRQLGIRGEFTIHLLKHFGDTEVLSSLCRRDPEISSKLIFQTEAWLRHISPGLRLTIPEHPSMDLVQLQYQFEGVGDTTPGFRATNVGFGLTYVLPVIVAILASQPGNLVIVENPEAHLHPSGQLRLGLLMAMAAAAGVQILAETHSDHILNGVRLAVHDGLVAPDNIRIHFFERDAQDPLVHRHHSPIMDRRGKLDRWPAGFFDEWERALARLLVPPRT